MEYCWVQTAFGLLFFSFTISFSIFSLLLFITRFLKPLCDCDTCRAYLSRSWLSEFDNLSDWYSHLLRHSPTGTIQIHVLNNTITSNPLNVEHMLKTRFDNYPKGKPFSVILGDLLGNGIFNVDGCHWNFQRKMASLELGSVAIRSYASEIVNLEIESRLIPLLSLSKGVFDFQDIFRRLTFDNTCRISFGFDPKCLEPSLPMSNFAEAFDLASKLSAERAMIIFPMVWKIKRFFNIGSEKKLKQAIKSISSLADDVIMNKRRTEFSSQNDLLSRFMGSVEDKKYLRDIVLNFLLAGRDTVAAALTSFFWLLTQHPEVLSAVRVESDLVMGQSHQGLASFEQMRKMHYLHAAIHESMRLFPPVQFDSKLCKEDDVLPDGTIVKKGTKVTYHPYAMGRMDQIWGLDCLEFKPERWLKDGVFRPVSPFKYPVFQGGLRVCLGKELAIMEVKSVALSLIRQFDILQAGPIQQPKFIPGLTATIKGGLPVLVCGRRM